LIKSIILVLSWFLTGGLAYHSFQTYGEIQRLERDASSLQVVRQQYQQQVDINTQQRQEFETQVQQLQSSLFGAQTQMTNLSAALLEAREMIDPRPAPANNDNNSDSVQ
jgi:hypothetical protein